MATTSFGTSCLYLIWTSIIPVYCQVPPISSTEIPNRSQQQINPHRSRSAATKAKRFARRYRYEPPSEFPLTSPFSGIVHHLSGPNRCAHTQTSLNRSVGCWCKYPSSHFHCASRFTHPGTCTYVRLLGPCFKTGRVKPFCQHRSVKERTH